MRARHGEGPGVFAGARFGVERSEFPQHAAHRRLLQCEAGDGAVGGGLRAAPAQVDRGDDDYRDYANKDQLHTLVPALSKLLKLA